MNLYTKIIIILTLLSACSEFSTISTIPSIEENADASNIIENEKEAGIDSNSLIDATDSNFKPKFYN